MKILYSYYKKVSEDVLVSSEEKVLDNPEQIAELIEELKNTRVTVLNIHVIYKGDNNGTKA